MAYNLFSPLFTFQAPFLFQLLWNKFYTEKKGGEPSKCFITLISLWHFGKHSLYLGSLFNLLTLLKDFSSVVINKSPSYPRHLREVWLRGCGHGWVEMIPERKPEDRFPESRIFPATFKSHEPTAVDYIIVHRRSVPFSYQRITQLHPHWIRDDNITDFGYTSLPGRWFKSQWHHSSCFLTLWSEKLCIKMQLPLAALPE